MMPLALGAVPSSICFVISGGARQDDLSRAPRSARQVRERRDRPGDGRRATARAACRAGADDDQRGRQREHREAGQVGVELQLLVQLAEPLEHVGDVRLAGLCAAAPRTPCPSAPSSAWRTARWPGRPRSSAPGCRRRPWRARPSPPGSFACPRRYYQDAAGRPVAGRDREAGSSSAAGDCAARISMPRKRPGGADTNRTQTAPHQQRVAGRRQPLPVPNANENSISAPSAALMRVSTPSSSDSADRQLADRHQRAEDLRVRVGELHERQEEAVGLVGLQPVAERRHERRAVQPVALQLAPSFDAAG